MKLNITFLLLFIINNATSQERITSNFGEPTQEEFNLAFYKNDPEAAGVVLFESANNTIKALNGRTWLIKKIHKKIKVIKAKDFIHETVEIEYYKNVEEKEEVDKIVAITHNGNQKTYVNKENIYDLDENEYRSVKRFSFSNIKDGSILEYKYTITSPFFFSLDGWAFQEDLPKIYSEFYSEIPGNYIYNRSIRGKKKLYINSSDIKRKCFRLPGFVEKSNCEVSLYAMKDIPAAKEENHMLSLNNYTSNLKFELMQYNGLETIKKFSKTWKNADREFKVHKNIGRKLVHEKFFKKNLPQDIQAITNELEKAKEVYYFIQQHYTWNGDFDLYGNVNIKNAFNKNSGNISEINLSLINALRAVNLNAQLVMHSTRNNGLPTKSYPVLNDFNYILVLLTIDETNYLLDASKEFVPFAILPFRALNKEVRVLDFNKGSYWLTIQPYTKNENYTHTQISINDDGSFMGKVQETHTGYNAISQRASIFKSTNKDIKLTKERNNNVIEVSEYRSENDSNLEKPLHEYYNIIYEPETVGANVHINPFFLQNDLLENPFNNEKREYPIDFGYPDSNTYLLKINLNNKYKLIQLPKSKSVKLPDNAGSCTVIFTEANGFVNMRFSYKLNTSSFETDYYDYLKQFFTKVIDIQTKEVIVLQKI